MKLVNGPTVANALADAGSELNKLVGTEMDDNKLIEEVFVRFLARKPTEKELALGIEALKAAAEDQAKAAAALAEYEKTIPAKQAAWEASVGKPLVWTPLEPSELKSAAGATLTKQEDKSVVATGATAKDVYTFVAPTDFKGITAIRLEAINDAALPAGGPGRATNGNFVLSELKLSAAPKADPPKAEPVALQNASADFSQDNWHVAGAIDGSEDTGWAVMPEFGKTHTAIFETKADVGARRRVAADAYAVAAIPRRHASPGQVPHQRDRCNAARDGQQAARSNRRRTRRPRRQAHAGASSRRSPPTIARSTAN